MIPAVARAGLIRPRGSIPQGQPQVDWNDPINNLVVAKWLFGSLFDCSGRFNLSGVNSPPLVPGINGLALSLNGTNQYAVTATTFSISSVTVSAWVKTQDTTHALPVIGPQDGTNVSTPFLILNSTGAGGAFQDGTIAFYNGAAWTTYALGAGKIGDGKWHFVAALAKGTVVQIFWDGALVKNTTTSSLNFTGSSLGWRVGGDNVHPSIHFNGLIGSVSAYNRPLLASEVARLYADPWAGLIYPSDQLWLWGATSSGTTFNQSAQASSSSAASLIKQTGLPLPASSSAIASLLWGLQRSLSASSQAIASNIRQTGLPLSAPSSPIASLQALKVVLLSLAATSSALATLSRLVGKSSPASTTPSGTLSRQTGKPLVSSSTPVAAASALKVVLLSLAAASSSLAALSRRVGKIAQGSTSPAGATSRQTAKSLSSSNAAGGTLSRNTSLNRAASTAPVASAVASRLIQLLLRASSSAIATLDAVLRPRQTQTLSADSHYVSRAPAVRWVSRAPAIHYVARARAGSAGGSMKLPDFPDIAPGQVVTVAHDFGAQLPDGVALTGTPSITVSVRSGSDSLPQSRVGSPVIGTWPIALGGTGKSNTAILWQFQQGTVDGTIYVCETVCGRSDGSDKVEGWNRVRCVAPN